MHLKALRKGQRSWEKGWKTCPVKTENIWTLLLSKTSWVEVQREFLFSSLLTDDIAWRNSTKIHRERFRLDISKTLFTLRAFKHWNSILERWLISPCLSAFRKYLYNTLNNTLSSEMVRQSVCMIFVSPFQLNYSILCCALLCYCVII